MKMATSQAAKNIQAAQSTLKLLESIEPKAPILRLKCRSCPSTFTHEAAFVLRMTRSTGFFIPSSQCRKCRAKQRKPAEGKSKKGAPTNVTKVVKKTKAIKPINLTVEVQANPPTPKPVKKITPKRSLRSNREPMPLTHSPFSDLKLPVK